MNITEACEILLKGECIILPSDTVYGIAACAYKYEAVLRAFNLKERSIEKKMPVHYLNLHQISRDAIITPLLNKIINEFMPGKLTVIVKKLPTSKLCFVENNIAIRIPDHKIMLNILSAIDQPLMMSSANKSGFVQKHTFQEIQQELSCKQLIYGIEDDKNITKIHSTIIDITAGIVKMIREGAIKIEELENRLNAKII